MKGEFAAKTPDRLWVCGDSRKPSQCRIVWRRQTRCPYCRRVHPDVAAEQPEVMAQGSVKAASPATPQEDRPVTPTKYTLDDFQVGQHVTAQVGPERYPYVDHQGGGGRPQDSNSKIIPTARYFSASS